MLRKCISPIQILAAACVGTVSLLFCVVASAGEAAAPTEKTSTTRTEGGLPKLDSDAILNALLALPPSERNKILVKLEQDLPGDARLPDRMKLAKDEEEPGAEEKRQRMLRTSRKSGACITRERRFHKSTILFVRHTKVRPGVCGLRKAATLKRR